MAGYSQRDMQRAIEASLKDQRPSLMVPHNSNNSCFLNCLLVMLSEFSHFVHESNVISNEALFKEIRKALYFMRSSQREPLQRTILNIRQQLWNIFKIGTRQTYGLTELISQLNKCLKLQIKYAMNEEEFADAIHLIYIKGLDGLQVQIGSYQAVAVSVLRHGHYTSYLQFRGNWFVYHGDGIWRDSSEEMMMLATCPDTNEPLEVAVLYRNN